MIGFSTGALAYSDFRSALKVLVDESIKAVEISALRISEWRPLLSELSSLQLATFEYISIHLPSAMNSIEERKVAQTSEVFARRRWPVVLHPDAISDFGICVTSAMFYASKTWTIASQLDEQSVNWKARSIVCLVQGFVSTSAMLGRLIRR